MIAQYCPGVRTRRGPQRWLSATACIVGLFGAAIPAVAFGEEDANSPHPVLIADQFNNRVIEVDRRTHEIVWRFGNGSDKPGPDSIVGVNDAARVGSLTLISGTGIPPSRALVHRGAAGR